MNARLQKPRICICRPFRRSSLVARSHKPSSIENPDRVPIKARTAGADAAHTGNVHVRIEKIAIRGTRTGGASVLGTDAQADFFGPDGILHVEFANQGLWIPRITAPI